MADFLKSLKVKGVEIDTAGATTNQVLTYNGTKFAPASAAGGGSTVTVSDNAPSSPTSGQIWYESDTGATFVYTGSAWVEIGATQGPYVCTSTTRPSSPYEGQAIYETDTDLTYIYNGSAWQQTGGGTSVGNSGLVYITKASWASGSSLSVNNCFTSTYSSYRLVIRNAKHATTAVNLLFRLRAGGVDKGTDSYYWSRQYIAMGGGSGGYTGASNSADIVPGIVATTANAGSGVIDLHDPQKSAITTCTFQGIWAATTGETGQGSGWLNTTDSYDGFSLIANTGNLTSLDVYVYGYRE